MKRTGNYRRPQSQTIITSDLCDYGCNTIAKYVLGNGKKCCSQHQNSCKGKRNAYSKLDHSLRTSKSLATRIEKGITKSSQIKGGATRVKQGHYKKLAVTMQNHWNDHPWDNNIQSPIVEYKNTGIVYQGSYEYDFLEKLEIKNGIKWIVENVSRGPSIWYEDPTDNTKRLYISDFIVYDRIYEIKSSYTWNKLGKDLVLETKNKAKLKSAIGAGYEVTLVLDKEEIDARTLDGTLQT